MDEEKAPPGFEEEWRTSSKFRTMVREQRRLGDRPETTDAPAPKRKKASYVGVPAIFKLNLACMHLNDAYGDGYGCYLVGSALERPDWRDVDVVMILDDEAFRREFPNAEICGGAFECDPKWLVLTVTISDWLKAQTGLPIDFKFQPRTWANERHTGVRNALGMRVVRSDD